MARRRRHLSGDLEGAFSDPSVAGPLLGGGVTQAASLATRLLFKKSPNIVKWSNAIGFLLGGGVSAALLFTRHKQAGLSGLVTSALIAVPNQIESMMGGSLKGSDSYLGVTVPEREMNGAFGYEDASMGAFGDEAQQDIQLLDGGSGSTGVLGVVTPEREMAGAFGAGGGGGDIELLGFGSNFLSSM